MIELLMCASLIAEFFVFFIVLFVKRKDSDRIKAASYAALFMIIGYFLTVSLAWFSYVYFNYKDENRTGNVAQGVYCPVGKNGNYESKCYLANFHKKPFSYYYNNGLRNPHDIYFDTAGNVISRNGSLYLEVSSDGFYGDNYVSGVGITRSNFIKFSDLGKLFDENVDINSLVDPDISMYDPQSIPVIGFDKNTKKPILNKD